MNSFDLLRAIGRAIGLRDGAARKKRPTAPDAKPKPKTEIRARIAPNGRVVMRIPIDPDNVVELVTEDDGKTSRAASQAKGDNP